METLDKLIALLCEESDIAVPNLSNAEKQNYFRALCNARPPLPISDEFLTLQDRWLTEQTRLRGVVDVNKWEYKNALVLWQGDITRLNADAVVNACNSRLLGCFQPLHNCIDNIIHSNAGVQVRLDCQNLMQGKEESNGNVKVTKAYNLPSRYIFHTVGPIVSEKVTPQNQTDLANCYRSCLNKAAEMKLQQIAFCCISTGVYGYPKAEASQLAVQTVKAWQKESGSILKIIFNVFTDEDRRIYERELS